MIEQFFETFRAKNSETIKHWWEIEGKVKLNNSKKIEPNKGAVR